MRKEEIQARGAKRRSETLLQETLKTAASLTSPAVKLTYSVKHRNGTFSPMREEEIKARGAEEIWNCKAEPGEDRGKTEPRKPDEPLVEPRMKRKSKPSPSKVSASQKKPKANPPKKQKQNGEAKDKVVPTGFASRIKRTKAERKAAWATLSKEERFRKKRKMKEGSPGEKIGGWGWKPGVYIDKDMM